ncbi:MAG: glycosyltransferase [Verrucomicrobia bacterium]|nr:glycosyltransferase [Verrucomicrobiota bacterium]
MNRPPPDAPPVADPRAMMGSAPHERVRLDGKFFRRNGRKWHAKGLTYGPFAPNDRGETFASPDQTTRDFRQLADLHANALRVYCVPPQWFLDLALAHGLSVLVDVPWAKHLCFLDSTSLRREARHAVRQAARHCGAHPAVFALSVVNEIPAEIVRWSGPRRVERFIDELIAEARDAAPDALCTFTSFPPTEFLRPESPDFTCFNVYLHQRPALEAYLARLHSLAGPRPLVLGEFGMDAIREGEAAQGEFVSWQIEAAFQEGLAGTFVFSFTDDWHRGGMPIEDWAFGLTTRDRRPKVAFGAVQRQYARAPHIPLPRTPRVSVVVASYNGGRTLRACLDSLQRLHYPDYEVILVDDGSTDDTPAIAAAWPQVRYVRQPNLGLSAARNAGVAAATGEIVAFTDADCRADEDWLWYLVGDLVRGGWAGIGGHNFLPPDDSSVAAVVAASPGGPAQVMLTDRQAEHVPGCNMAFWKWTLEAIGGFDPVFRQAGDDVDVCWRLMESGHRIGFSPGGFVWHYRRSTIRAYLRQQAGYGQAEALLARKHPEHFSTFGGGIWRGRIYATASPGLVFAPAVIYHGVFGTAFFQKLYAPAPAWPLMLCTSLAWHALVTVPLWILAAYVNFALPLAAASFALTLGVCAAAATQAPLPRARRRLWSRPLVAAMFLLQPIARGWARFTLQLNAPAAPDPHAAPPHLDPRPAALPELVSFWTRDGMDRTRWLETLLHQLESRGWPVRPDSGWDAFDLEVLRSRWSRLRLTTATEELGQNRRVFRCRLRRRWSVMAWLVFAHVAGLVAVALVRFAALCPWLWLALVLVPLIDWYLDDDCECLHQEFLGLLEETARDSGLVQLPADAKP